MATTIDAGAPVKKQKRGIRRRVARAGGMRLAKRIIKPIPIIGTAVTLGMAGHEIRKKGLRNGVIHVGLDLVPIVGTIKDVIEIFTGDLIPDKDGGKS
ncbi:MAG TPA: hypothetical protein VF538_15430 [Pyrinomonadaceae bacterium]|jgi:hypothetical protein